MVLRVARISHKYGLEINTVKTKWMIVHRNRDTQSIENDGIRIDSKEIKRVDKFLYLTTWFQKEMDQYIEIKMRIGNTKSTFMRMKNILAWKNLDMSL